jgi:RNA polymerase sigma-70 factor (ECF subfamily)
LLGDGAAAEDATHDVFCRVQRHLSQVPDGPEALRWLVRVATNLCLNQLRDKRRQACLLPLDAEPVSCLYPTANDVANRVHTRWLMSQVPEKLRAAAWLRHVEGMDQQEIADLLGVSRRTVVYRLASFRHAVQGMGRTRRHFPANLNVADPELGNRRLRA